MKKKWISIIVILIVTIGTGIFIYRKYINNNDTRSMSEGTKNKYDASKEIKNSLKLLNSNKRAEVITNVETSAEVVALSFEGMSDAATMERIIELLDVNGIKATFFIPAIEAGEDTTTVKGIKKAGHEIGSATLSETKHMERLPQEELVTDFCRANKVLETIIKENPVLLKCKSTVYTDEVLRAAYASGNEYVVQSNNYLSYQSFKEYEQVQGYVDKLGNGTIISIKLDGVLDGFEYEIEKAEEKSTIGKQASLDEPTKEQKEEITIIKIVEWVLKAIKDQEKSVVQISELVDMPKVSESILIDNISNIEEIYIDKGNEKGDSQINNQDKKPIDSVDFKGLIEKNNGKVAPVVSEIYTTKEALSYTFRGLSNEVVLDEVLLSMEKVSAKGTFFVTKDEMKKYPDRIQKILKAGHEIGNGGITTSSTLLDKSTEEICKEIYEVDELLKKEGINTKSYMPGYGYVDVEVQEALSVINSMDKNKNYELVTYSKSPINHKYENMNAEEIVADYLNINTYMSLRKGEIVYFRMDTNLFHDNSTVANIIEVITTNYVKNGHANRYNKLSESYDLVQKPLGYSVMTLNELQSTMEVDNNLGRYSFQGNNIKSLTRKPYEEAISIMKTNYIGNKNVNLSDLTEEEQLVMDKSGTIDTKGENVIFFTFDDWGGDPIINEILDIFEKHKAKGSFFAISKYSDINSGISNVNPNLLRTIAINGHDIGSHNYNHEILDSSKEELEISLTKSYDGMANVIGDLDSLRPYFRPPTLLIKREGLATVFESGFKYSISGNISTHDYESSSSQEIVDSLEKNLIKGVGNIIVMHMNDQSYYTAEALDIFLTNNENGVYGEKYKIARLSEYLGK
ncbi:MAG: polysaccharide deacetylase family protein [Clostridium sp.]|uniref:polysaccharide deacetylase family protein n=1 Tax=Clostridium sp. TaxID=1506 RepID=UPI00304CAF64